MVRIAVLRLIELESFTPLSSQVNTPGLRFDSVMPDANDKRVQQNMGDLVIVTYWNSFEQHEKSHADALFKEHFSHLASFCDSTFEVGYEMLWQGVPEDE